MNDPETEKIPEYGEGGDFWGLNVFFHTSRPA